MSIINKIPRGLRVLFVMLVLAVLVWQLAYNKTYYYYAIGAAVLVTALTIFAVYRSRSSQQSEEVSWKKKTKPEAVHSEEEGAAKAGDELAETEDNADHTPASSEESETIAIEPDYTDIPTFRRKPLAGDFKSNASRPDAVEEAARYRRMADTVKTDSGSDFILPSIKAAESRRKEVAPVEDIETGPDSGQDIEKAAKADTVSADGTAGEPPIPMREDESTLSLEEINELVNAVWYRCENPYCKYTSFLTVHHIVDEKEGGDNTLDNLIVLCPYCHDLAHRNEIPQKEMREWIVDREDRFKFKPDWHYFKNRPEE
jgi:5-methylcytosine-specific restriction endonuclease McrA